MKAIKIVAIVLIAYVAVVAIFESLLGYFQPQADNTVVITTFDADAAGHDRVLTGLESGGRFYVAVNHWPRGWYRRALAHPFVQVARAGNTESYRAIPVTGAEHDRLEADHPIPLGVRFLMGFAPRRFLRLDPTTD